MSAGGHASVTAGSIEGCAIQTATAMDRFDVDEYPRSLQARIISPTDSEG